MAKNEQKMAKNGQKAVKKCLKTGKRSKNVKKRQKMPKKCKKTVKNGLYFPLYILPRSEVPEPIDQKWSVFPVKFGKYITRNTKFFDLLISFF